MRLYGVTDEGHSVMAHLHGYIPYFYASVPSETFTAADCERFKVHPPGARSDWSYLFVRDLAKLPRRLAQ